MRKAHITVEFGLDGEFSKELTFEEAFFKWMEDCGSIIPSENVDGTEDWAIEIQAIEVSVEDNTDG